MTGEGDNHNSLSKKVLIADKLEDICEKILSDNGISVDYKPEITPEELLSIIPNYNGIVVRSKTKVPKEIIEAGKNLEIIGRPGAGVDTIDVQAANKKGIAVVNTPFSNKYAVSELVFGYMSALSRSLIQYDSSTKKGEWKKGKLSGKSELFGKTIGIVGLGNIGKEVAKRAEGFGMNVIYYDPFIKSHEKYKSAEMKELFKNSDFVTIHVPGKEDTNGMVTYEMLENMKGNAVLINTSRAEVIKKGSLEEILEKRSDIKAAADVFYKGEEKEGEKTLAKFGDRVILTPHIGASTDESQIRGAQGVAEQIIEFFKSGRAACALNIPRLDEEYLPYRGLAEKIAYLGCNVLGTKPDKIEISCYGKLKDFSQAFMNIALMMVLKYKSDLNVNEINASYLGKERGIEAVVREGDESKGYGNSITLDLNANGDKTSIRGTIDDGKVKFMRIGDYGDMAIVAEGKQLMAVYDESYGILEAIGHVLANNKLSVVSMNSGEDKKNNREIAFLRTKTDKLLNETQLYELKNEIFKRKGKSIREDVNVYQVKHLDFDNVI